MRIYVTRTPIAGRELLRRALCAEGLLSPDAPLPPLMATQRGKPYFLNEPAFNLTHTAGLTAVAIGEGEIGLDAERRAARRLEHLRARLTEAERKEDFYDLWTAKEAYIKFRGGTLAEMLGRLVYTGGTLFEGGMPVNAAFLRLEYADCTLCLCTASPAAAELAEL